MSSSSTSTVYGTSSSKRNAYLNSLPTDSSPNVYRTMYIDDEEPWSLSRTPELNNQMTDIKGNGKTTHIDDVTEALNAFKISPYSIEYQPPDHWQPDHGIRQMTELCRDLLSQKLFSPVKFLAPNEIKLKHDYIFLGPVGMKKGYLAKVNVAVGISESPEIAMVSFSGRQVRAVAIGYCLQFDSEVYFGVDGKIYLVDAYLLSMTARTVAGLYVFESKGTLDSDWRTFA